MYEMLILFPFKMYIFHNGKFTGRIQGSETLKSKYYVINY